MSSLRSQQWLAGTGASPTLARALLRSQVPGAMVFDERPVIGICDTSSQLNPCNAPLQELSRAVAQGVWRAGGTPLSFPTISLGEPFVRPTTMLLRNLMAMDVEEMIRAQPIDAVVLLGSCDKTLAALLMGAASVDVPAILFTGGPMLPGQWRGEEVNSGTDLRRYEEARLAGLITDADYRDLEAHLTGSLGHCAVMGTATTMAILAETLGLSLVGSAAMAAVDPRRSVVAELVGERAVTLARDGPRPSEVLTRPAFENAVRVLMAVGGSTNAVIHLMALAGRVGVPLTLGDFDRIGRSTPVLLDVKPSGTSSLQDFDQAGSLPGVLWQLGDLLHDTAGIDGPLRAHARVPADNRLIRSLMEPIRPDGAIAVLSGSLAPEGAIVKVSAASGHLNRHRGPAVVFDDRDALARRLADLSWEVDPDTVMILRGAGPIGGPGMPEWGWWPVPAALRRRGVRDIVRISDGRMSGTAFGTVILHVVPEAAVGGPLALVKDGDIVVLDIPARRLDLEVAAAELDSRRAHLPVRPSAKRGYLKLYLEHVTPATAGCDFDFLQAIAR